MGRFMDESRGVSRRPRVALRTAATSGGRAARLQGRWSLKGAVDKVSDKINGPPDLETDRPTDLTAASWWRAATLLPS